jgi:hypothetical protein
MKTTIRKQVVAPLVVLSAILGAALVTQSNQAKATTLVNGLASKMEVVQNLKVDSARDCAPLSWVQGPIHTA